MDKPESEMDLSYYSDTRTAALKFNDSGHKKYLQVDFDDAIDDYTKAIELDPDLAVAYYNRGTVLYRLGHYKEALEDLAKAVELQPKNVEFVEGHKECQMLYEEYKKSL